MPVLLGPVVANTLAGVIQDRAKHNKGPAISRVTLAEVTTAEPLRTPDKGLGGIKNPFGRKKESLDKGRIR
ncbi:hypothetical protein CCM_03768 [Cordyceps militaris CM01]|uniref:Uncharacterized protein n=2 Tax=Cordyceps militaris TaxID=73501 RepID=G3JGH8_CORMM|nr:uncharacterized protein CCM_03768 [Cordyceps militaris CM01]ATY66689.1 hypothetical protein A9K55_001031 [Cordyceps militaris]EGX92395.1 hypothetical protein CCM_03768 [Cordyceps militaris CM01]